MLCQLQGGGRNEEGISILSKHTRTAVEGRKFLLSQGSLSCYLASLDFILPKDDTNLTGATLPQSRQCRPDETKGNAWSCLPRSLASIVSPDWQHLSGASEEDLSSPSWSCHCQALSLGPSAPKAGAVPFWSHPLHHSPSGSWRGWALLFSFSAPRGV